LSPPARSSTVEKARTTPGSGGNRAFSTVDERAGGGELFGFESASGSAAANFASGPLGCADRRGIPAKRDGSGDALLGDPRERRGSASDRAARNHDRF